MKGTSASAVAAANGAGAMSPAEPRMATARTIELGCLMLPTAP